MKHRVFLSWISLLVFLACTKTSPQKPAKLPAAAKAEKGGVNAPDAVWLSEAMSVSAGVALFDALSSRLTQAQADDEVVSLGAILKSQGLVPPGTCASTGLLGVLQPEDVSPEVGELHPAARGMIVFFQDPDSPGCAAGRTPCSITLVPDGKDRVRVRLGELSELTPEGKLTSTSSALTGDAWIMNVEMGSILDCGRKLQEGEVADEGDPGFGEVGSISNERSGMVVLLFSRGMFHEVNLYLSQHSQRSGFYGFMTARSHDVTRIQNDDHPGAGDRFLFTLSDERQTIEINSETHASKKTLEASWECFWVDLDANALIPLSKEEIDSLRKRPEPQGLQCGETHGTDETDEPDGK